jgi:nitrite reductase/ring-hydroxylating ferredoxin subunit
MGDVAVFSVAGGFCATQATCTHRAGPLSEGAVDDTTVTCPLHGSQFDIWTGRCSVVRRENRSRPIG